MASLKSIVKDHADEFRDGIAWIAVWKEGRSWKSQSISAEGYAEFTGDFDEALEIHSIIAVDPDAVVLNGYYLSGIPQDGEEYATLADIEQFIRRHYEDGSCMLSHLLELPRLVDIEFWQKEEAKKNTVKAEPAPAEVEPEPAEATAESADGIKVDKPAENTPPMRPFYFTYSKDGSQPFIGGWTLVYATDYKSAVKKFSRVHPNGVRGEPDCAVVYEQPNTQRWLDKHGNHGAFCHEVLE